MRLSLYFITIFILCQNLFAQTFIISGEIRDRNGVPLIGVNILVDGTLIGTASDSKGKFQLRGIKPGKYKLIASMVGYSKFVSEEIILEKNISSFLINLEYKTYQSDQVVVTAGKYEQNLRDLPVSALVIDGDKIPEKNFRSFDQMMRYIPGVSVTLDQISVRGSSGYSRGVGTRVLIAFDGIPLYTGDSGEIIWEIIPINEIERVEVIKGAASSLYGSTALGGVVNIISKNITSNPLTYINTFIGAYSKPSHKIWEFSNSLRTFYGLTVSHSRSIGNLGISLSLSRYSDMSYRQNDWDKRYAGFIKAKYIINGSTAISFFGSGYDRQRASFNFWKDIDHALSPPENDLGVEVPSNRYLFGMIFNHVFTQNFSLSVKPSIYKTHWRDEFENRNRSTTYLYRSEIQSTLKFDESKILVSGIELQKGDVSSNIYGNNRASSFGVYSQFDYEIASPFKLSLGIRYDYSKLSSLNAESSLSPKFGMNYKFSESTIIRTSIGKGFRAPTLAEAYTSTIASGLIVKPNPNIESETNYSFEVGVNHTFNENFIVDLAVFQNEYYDLIEPHIDIVDLKAIFDNITRARIQGAELNTSIDLLDDLISVNLGYTYLRARDIKMEKALKYRPRHSAVISLDVRPGNFSFGCDFRYASKVEQIDFELIDAGIVKDGDERVEILVLDLRAGVNLFSIGYPLRIFININNILNYNYVEIVGNLSPIRNFSINVELMF